MKLPIIVLGLCIIVISGALILLLVRQEDSALGMSLVILAMVMTGAAQILEIRRKK